ncbi:MAG: FHA domain-containing protein [Anaerolineae bacterium]|nr:FHA domain-containing protein [Anaerolineae bacterium]
MRKTTAHMIICTNCGKPNPEGVLFCENCGEPFVAGGPSRETAAIRHRVIEEPPHAITVQVQGASRKFVLEMLNAPFILGRADPEADFMPEVELSPFDAVRLGVSRRHAMISWGSGGVTIEDLGSYNGTFVSGRRLPPHERHPLKDSDEVILGDLVLNVYFGDR